MISHERLSEIKARHEKATPGPWQVSARRSDGAAAIGPLNPSPTRAPFVVREILIEDAAFVAGSRQDVPDLVEEVERLQKALAESEAETARARTYGILQAEREVKKEREACAKLCDERAEVMTAHEALGDIHDELTDLAAKIRTRGAS